MESSTVPTLYCWLVDNWAPVSSYVEKPGNSTRTVYGPGWTAAKLKTPTSFVTVLRIAPVASCSRVTVAPGRTRPPSSTTFPENPPVVVCAFASGAWLRASRAANRILRVLLIDASSRRNGSIRRTGAGFAPARFMLLVSGSPRSPRGGRRPSSGRDVPDALAPGTARIRVGAPPAGPRGGPRSEVPRRCGNARRPNRVAGSRSGVPRRCGNARWPDRVMRRSRRPAPRRGSGLRGALETEDRWIVHAAGPCGHAGFGSRIAAAPAGRNGGASAGRTVRGAASRPPAEALEVRRCVHRASPCLVGAGQSWRRPRSLRTGYGVRNRAETREIPRFSRFSPFRVDPDGGMRENRDRPESGRRRFSIGGRS